MHGQIVEEQSNLVVAIELTELSQPLLELRDIYRLREYSVVFYSFFLGNSGQKGQTWFVYFRYIYGHVLFGQSPLGVGHRIPGEACLVEINDPIPFCLRLRKCALHFALLNSGPVFILLLCLFEPSILFLFDSVLLVYLP